MSIPTTPIKSGASGAALGSQLNNQAGAGTYARNQNIATFHALGMRPRILLGGGGGLQFQTPYLELDSSVDVAAQTVVYISPGNPLVTAGLTDLVTGLTVKATAGFWAAMQAVPAATDAGYNVPQLPYPGATGTPSGSPLQGDLDGVNVFWAFLGSTPVCPTV